MCQIICNEYFMITAENAMVNYKLIVVLPFDRQVQTSEKMPDEGWFHLLVDLTIC